MRPGQDRPGWKKSVDRSEQIRQNDDIMKLSLRIKDHMARLNGFLCAAPSQAWCGGARPGRVAAVKGWCFRTARFAGATAIAAGVLIGLSGCQTKPQSANFGDPFALVAPAGTVTNRPAGPASEPLVLREGDVVRISFPGSPSLNTVQQIRRDGKVSLALVGEFHAAGLTLAQLEKELVKLYAPQLVTKEVTVALESSTFLVYVTGAVLRPGRLLSDRPLTALEAVLDAGVDHQKANLKSVTVIRRLDGREEAHTLNLKKALQGIGGEPFYLKPSDVIYVRERFTWF